MRQASAVPRIVRPGLLGGTAWRLAGLSGWRRLAAAAGFGALTTLAMPPAFLVPLLLPAYAGLVWMLDRATPRIALRTGWAFGFGQFAFGLYWIGFAFLVDAPRYGLLALPAVLGLAAGLALFPALACAAACPGNRAEPGSRLTLLLRLTVALALGEWLRGHILTGFPWNLTGYAWAGFPGPLQAVSVVGIYGLGIVTLFWAGLPALLAADRGAVRRWGLVGLVAIPLLLWAGGTARLALGPDAAPLPDAPVLRLVQPNIPQAEKWVGGLRERNLARHLALTREPGLERVAAVIWPEAALPLPLDRDPGSLALLDAGLPQGTVVLTGAIRATPPGEPLEIWNSLLALEMAPAVGLRALGAFDKAHLVPFGEYMPFRDWLAVGPLTQSTDFTAGPGPRTLRIAGLPAMGPLICYEVIFPGAVIDAGDRPAWMVNLTNDGWYGVTAGPHQHAAIARVRAAEEGIPLVRVANTGISFVADAYGGEIARIPLDRAGILDQALPPPLPPTLFARLGDLPFALLLAAGLLAALLLAPRPGRRGGPAGPGNS